MSAAKLIFAQAICQPDGDPLIITCRDFSEAERIRIGLYRERTQLFKADPVLAARLVIARKQIEGKWSVIIGADEPGFTIKTAKGKKVDIVEIACALSETAEIDRRLQLMREDGYSEKQLEKERKSMLEDLEGGDSPAK